jgi:hypothetical protein
VNLAGGRDGDNRQGLRRDARGYVTASQPPTLRGETAVLLIVAIVLLCIAIAGGVIIHPGLFVLALIAIAVYFSAR